jgi:hypothetical protein
VIEAGGSRYGTAALVGAVFMLSVNCGGGTDQTAVWSDTDERESARPLAPAAAEPNSVATGPEAPVALSPMKEPVGPVPVEPVPVEPAPPRGDSPPPVPSPMPTVPPAPVPLESFEHYRVERGEPPYRLVAGPGEPDAGAAPALEPISTERGGEVERLADGSYSYTPPGGARFWGDDHFVDSLGSDDSLLRRRVRVSVLPGGAIDLLDVVDGVGNGFAILAEPLIYAQAGAGVSTAGDVDGDGRADLLVGSPGYDLDRGAVHIVYGKPDPAQVSLLELPAERGLAWFGARPGDLLGYGVGHALALGSDGRDGVLAVAPGRNGYAGRGYASLDPAGVEDLDALGETGFAVDGARPADDPVLVLSAAGDVDGDGRGDWIAGDRSWNGETGSAYIGYGTAGAAPLSLGALELGAGGGEVLRGAELGARFGASVAGAGDVNGDGLADVVIGEPYRDGLSGGATVLFGPGDEGFAILGHLQQALVGTAVAGAGDVNGDGLDDVLVSTPLGRIDGEPFLQGMTYVVWGTTDRTPVDLLDFERPEGSERGFLIWGPNTNDSAGQSVAGAGDVNGDGLADIVIGALTDENLVGGAFIVYGKRDAGALQLAEVAGDASLGVRLRGIEQLDYVGFSVAGAGDVNADGLSDVIVGGPGASGYSGAAYVLFGWDATDALGSRRDAFIGGPGGDVFEFSGQELVSIRGNAGIDTLAVVGDTTLDSRAFAGRVESIEIIDLRAPGRQRLELDDAAIRRLPQSRPGLPGGLSKTLVVLRDEQDVVALPPDYELAAAGSGTELHRKPGAHYGVELEARIPPNGP